jgi:4-amino-4-deoxy-L-arabinose transferase-like glycosyltransferase
MREHLQISLVNAGGIGPPESALRSHATPWLIAFSFAALVWALTARIAGPCDLWDQTQQKTISYTTDIIVHGQSHWVLPIEAGTMPATKPPMYNWIAVPFVNLLGFSSELAHKFPSVIAITLCWLIIVRIGRRIDPGSDQALGWLAGLILIANSPMFKLGYLARPDMLLTLWLLCSWAISTAALIKGSASVGTIAAFWLFISLAGLTKGPAAIVDVLYVVIAARIIGGRWSAVQILRPMIGLPVCALLIGVWIYGVWRLNPEHLTHVLWHNEIFGRFTGTGPLGNKEGFAGWVRTFPEQGLYFVIRFVPWSVWSILAIMSLWRPNPDDPDRRRGWRTIPGDAGSWLCGAAIQVVLVVGLFTLSASKRADYIAAAFPPGALLAAWWLLHMGSRIAARRPRFAPLTAVAVLLVLSLLNELEMAAPARGFGNNMRSFVNQATEAMSADPMPLAFIWIDDTHFQAMFGASERDDKEAVEALLETRRPFWVIAGRKISAPENFGEWFSPRRNVKSVEPVVRSAMMPRNEHWPEQVTLFKVVPTRSAEP